MRTFVVEDPTVLQGQYFGFTLAHFIKVMTDFETFQVSYIMQNR